MQAAGNGGNRPLGELRSFRPCAIEGVGGRIQSAVIDTQAEISVPEYVTTSYTGYECRTREYYPAWVMPEDHPLIVAMTQAARSRLKRRPTVTRWDFSTEGVYTAGIAHIPTVGFGPGDPKLAHAADERVKLDDVYTAAEVYAQLAQDLLGET